MPTEGLQFFTLQCAINLIPDNRSAWLMRERAELQCILKELSYVATPPRPPYLLAHGRRLFMWKLE
jgi:hypothetical protein